MPAIAFTPFLASYIETALWSSIADNEDPLDECFSSDDLSPEALAKCNDDCERFKREIAHLDLEGYTEARIAHDFWLTRNRHGAGFWDGDYEEVLGERLTDIAHAFGTVDLYAGDDGKLYC